MDDIKPFFECSICGKKLELNDIMYNQNDDDNVFCRNCFEDLHEPNDYTIDDYNDEEYHRRKDENAK